MNKNQLLSIGGIQTDKLQAYVAKINKIQNADLSKLNHDKKDVWQSLQIKQYANALSELEPTQAAVLLSTQGLTNAQIQQTLAAKGLSTEMQYQAMAEAGLLARKREMTNVELQSTIASQLNSDARAEEVMSVMGLNTAMVGEEAQTVKLTAHKLKLAVSSGILTEAEAQQLAITTNVSVAQSLQANSVLPKWIAQIKASTTAIWAQVKATAAWLATNPVGWVIIASTAIVGIVSIIKGINKAIDEHRQKIIEAGETAKQSISSAKSEIDSLKDSVDKATESYSRLLSGVDSLTNKNLSLSSDDYKEFLDTNNNLAETFPELVIGLDSAGNAILDLGTDANSTVKKLNELIEAHRKVLAETTRDSMSDVFKGLYEGTRDARNEYDRYIKEIQNTDSNLLITDILGAATQAGGKNISLSEVYKEGIDSQSVINSIAQMLNSQLGTDLKTEYNDMTGEYYLDLVDMSDEQFQQAMQILYQNSGKLADDIVNQYTNASKESKDKINQSYKENVESILTGLSFDDEYVSLNDNNKKLVDAIIANLDYSEYADEIKGKYNNDIYKFIYDNLLNGIYNSSDSDKEKISQAYSKLLSLDPNASYAENQKVIDKYVNQLVELLEYKFSAKEIKIALGIEVDEAKIERAQRAITGSTYTVDARTVNQKRNNPNYQPSDEEQINQYIETLSDEDLDLVLSMSVDEKSKIETAQDLDNWLDEQREKKLEIPVSTAIDAATAADATKSAFEALTNALADYQENGIVNMDISNLTKLNSEDMFGNINGSTADLEKFLKVLQDTDSTAEEVQDAFNNLATAYLYHSELSKQITEDNKAWVVEELNKNGVINSEEVAEHMLTIKLGALNKTQQEVSNSGLQLHGVKLTTVNATKELENATVGEIAELLRENIELGNVSDGLYTYLSEKIDATNNTLMTNADIDNLIALCEMLGIASDAFDNYKAHKDMADGTITGSATADYYQKQGEAKLAKDTALDSINARIASVTKVQTTNTGSYGGSKSSDSGGSDTNNDSSKDYDWIKIAIERCEKALSRLNKVEENTYTDWSKRNNALAQEISKTSDEISLQQSAYKAYMDEANAIDLSDEYKKKVQDGTIQIETVEDADLQKNIDSYQELYEKAEDCKDKIDDLNISLSELAEQNFNNIVSQFEEVEDVFESLNNSLDAYIDLAESKGRIISRVYYDSMIQNESRNNELLKQQKDQMINSLNEAVSSGAIVQYSEAWYDLQQQILDTDKAIIESDNALQEFNNKIRDLDWEIFDLIQDKVSNLADEIEFMSSLLDDEKLTDGYLRYGLTDEGNAQMGNYASRYNIYMAQSEKYASEIKKIESEIAKDPANQDLVDRKQELVEAQQDVILSANQEKSAMIDLARDGYDAVLEVLQELIDKRTEALDAEKDLYEYQKSIATKTKNLASLQKRFSVFENDNSEEGRKMVQQLKVDIEEAQQDLRDTEYDKYISDQKDMMNKLYQDYSDKIDEKFEQVDILFQELISLVNNNSESINATLSTIAMEVGYTVSDELQTIWGDTGTVISNFNGKFDTYATTIQTALDGIKVTIDSMLKVAQDEAAKAAEAAQSSATTSTPTTNSSTSSSSSSETSTSSSSSSGGTATVGTKITSASGVWYVDSYGSKAGSNVNKYTPDYFLIDIIKSGRAYPYHIQAYKNGKASGGSGWVKGNQIGYKNGLKEAMYDHIAWTQENGAEMIRTSDGALLTPVSKGTTVFTRDMTNELWKFAKDPSEFINGISGMPKMNYVSNNNSNGGVELTIENINLPNVTKPDEFVDGLVDALKTERGAKAVLSIAVDPLAGKSRKRINRF